MEKFLEKASEVDIRYYYDTVIVGGGVAGVAAAIASARGGKKTLLIEEQYMLGGLATCGLITYYLPLCDGKGTQLSFGLAEELFRLSISVGEDNLYPSAWWSGDDVEKRKEKRYVTQFNPNVFSILLDEVVSKSGGDILFGTRLSKCILNKESNLIEGIIAENRSGRFGIKATNFIDATGDAILCELAGAKTALYQRKNELAAWYYENIDGEYRLQEVGCRDTDEAYEVIGRFQGIDGQELSDVTLQSHKIMLDRFLEKGKNSKKHSLATIPTIPQVRMTRRLVGYKTMTVEDDRKYIPDSVGMFGNWRKKGPAYEMPFGSLICKEIRNLATAGRSISADDDMWDLTRVIPPCVVSGEAVGTACALGGYIADTDIGALQLRLALNGVKLHLDEVEISYKE